MVDKILFQPSLTGVEISCLVIFPSRRSMFAGAPLLEVASLDSQSLRASTLHWEGLCTVGDLWTHKIRASWSWERSEIGSSFLRMRNAFGSGLLKLFLVFGCKSLWILPRSLGLESGSACMRTQLKDLL